MKHVIIIADGAADLPLAELGGRTPFEAARTPNLDALVRGDSGVGARLGVAVTTPPGFEAGSDVCSMCLLGYDPARYHTGRAPLEAAALGLDLAPADWIFRLNFVTVDERSRMVDHSAGAISSSEARQLVAALIEHWRRRIPEVAAGFSLTSGVSYRNILIDDGARSGRDYSGVRTTPPHEIPGEDAVRHLPMPAGMPATNTLRRLMDESRACLENHPVNAARIAAGKRPANMAWIWGQGRRPDMPAFAERFGRGRENGPPRGAMITAVDLLAGIAALIGWDRVESPGITSYHDTDYAMQGRVTCNAIDRYDIVCSHVESPDEASHQGDWKTKVAGIEAIDAHVVGPVVEHLKRRQSGGGGGSGGGGWRVLVLPDHYTLVSTRKHDATPPPWLIAGTDITGPPGDRSADAASRLTEACASAGGRRRVDPGDGIMELFLHGQP